MAKTIPIMIPQGRAGVYRTGVGQEESCREVRGETGRMGMQGEEFKFVMLVRNWF